MSEEKKKKYVLETELSSDNARLLNIAGQIFETIQTRGDAYNAPGVGRDAHFPFGIASHLTLVHMKSCRAVAAFKQGAENSVVRDSLYDLIAYALFAIDRLEREK